MLWRDSQILCSGGARKDSPLEAAGCTGRAAKLRVQALAKERCSVRAGCTRVRTAPATLGRGKNTTRSTRSPMQQGAEGEGVDAEAAQGARRAAASDLPGAIWRGSTTGRNTAGARLMLEELEPKSSTRTLTTDMSRGQSKSSTPRATGQPKGSMTSSRPWVPPINTGDPLPPIGSGEAMGASLTTHVRNAALGSRTVATPCRGLGDHCREGDSIAPGCCRASVDIVACRSFSLEHVVLDAPAMAFFEGLRRAPPAADALTD
ncbi:hypothetical protein OPT61_g2060 [Boeremia exigua]|uniref:Uncharacterized protein n=1 Tax=Boeremia exigua TaxID=749465 RepID=A0ACC2IN38_9PLEO|nr:hypothetical protein OPT61_g2060 [Boeremia exigua]